MRAGQKRAPERRVVELGGTQVGPIQYRALKIRAREIRLAQSGADQHSAFEMARAEGRGHRKGYDLRLSVELGVINHVKPRQYQPVRPQAFGLSGVFVDFSRNEHFAQRRNRRERSELSVQPFAGKGGDREHQRDRYDAEQHHRGDCANPPRRLDHAMAARFARFRGLPLSATPLWARRP